MLKPILASLAAWGMAGFGAVVGSILGNAAGKSALSAGAAVGGVVGVAVAVAMVIKLQWLMPDDRRGALVGAVVGFAVAIPIAVTHLHTPVIPVLACGLTGAGLLLGVWVTRGRRRRS